VEWCFQTVALQTYLRNQGSAITPSLCSVTKWKPCILCSNADSKTVFRSFIDTVLTQFFILCYYILQVKEYRPGGSHMNPIRSPWIWKQQFRSKRRNGCTTLFDVITPLFIYHLSYKSFQGTTSLNKVFPRLRSQYPISLHSPKLNTCLAVPLLSFLTTQMPQHTERNIMSPATFAAGPWQLHMHHV
jgi:hypothetical protein